MDDRISPDLPGLDQLSVTTRLTTPASRLRNARDKLKLAQMQSRLVAAEASPTLMAMLIRDAYNEQDVEVRHKLAISIMAYGIGKPGVMVDEDLENQRKAVGNNFFEAVAAFSAEANRIEQEQRRAVQQEPQQPLVTTFARHPLEDVVDVGDDE